MIAGQLRAEAEALALVSPDRSAPSTRTWSALEPPPGPARREAAASSDDGRMLAIAAANFIEQFFPATMANAPAPAAQCQSRTIPAGPADSPNACRRGRRDVRQLLRSADAGMTCRTPTASRSAGAPALDLKGGGPGDARGPRRRPHFSGRPPLEISATLSWKYGCATARIEVSQG